MNLVVFSLKTKGMRNFVRRLWTVFARFGITETRTRRALYTLVHMLRQNDGAPTFFIPAVVLDRHPRLMAEVVRSGAEVGIHGYVHSDYRSLSKAEQYRQTRRAMSVFQRAQIPYQGFRNPYLGWTKESVQVFTDLGFTYDSNEAVLHNVIDRESLPLHLRSGYEKSLALFQAIPCNAYALRPHFEGTLLRIPTSIPDDEMLFDRLRITNPREVGQIWSEVAARVYALGGIYTLNFHPERAIACKSALNILLSYARSRRPPVWVTSLNDVARWWKDRSQFGWTFSPEGEGRWQVSVTCTSQATILARHVAVENQQVQPWFGSDERVQSHHFTVSASTCPCIMLSKQTPVEVMGFLREQGYAVMECSSSEEAHRCSLYLDRPAGLGETSEERTRNKIALVEQIESMELPLLHFGCWPDGNRAALCISGDIDSITVQDFFLRIVEVFKYR